MKQQTKWNLKDGVADLNGPSFGLRVDTSTPELGGRLVFAQASTESAANLAAPLEKGSESADASLFQIRPLSV